MSTEEAYALIAVAAVLTSGAVRIVLSIRLMWLHRDDHEPTPKDQSKAACAAGDP